MYLDLKVVRHISELREQRFESIINRIDRHESATVLYKENLVLILNCLKRQPQLKDKFSVLATFYQKWQNYFRF
jgi:hypothetical protein